MTPAKTFVAAERAAQTTYFSRHLPLEPTMDGYPHRLAGEGPGANLAPSIRHLAPAYFKTAHPDGAITWHRHANHALSSQVCCLNFLMPLAEKPDLLARLVQAAVGGALPQMRQIATGPDGRPWFVDFEWIGDDLLNEANAKGRRTRGANVTSADAAMMFDQGGGPELLLVEWKYTERYGQPLPSHERDRPDGTRVGGNITRSARYRDLVFDGKGPICNDLDLSLADFFYEPFYQLLRQQMLAFQMVEHRKVARARVLHISPAGNIALHTVTSPALGRFGTDAFKVFRALLADPNAFISTSTEALFGPLLDDPGEATEWADYLKTRYTFLATGR